MVKNLTNHPFQLFLLYQAKSNLPELYNHYIITLQYLTLHHMQIHIHLCSMFDKTQIFGSHKCQNKETRSTPFKKKSLPENPVKLEELSSPRKDHTRSLPFESNSFYESSLFLLGNTFDQVQTYVSALGYHFSNSFQGYNPRLSTRLSFLILFKVLTHISALDYPFLNPFKVLTHVLALDYPFSIHFKVLTHVLALGYPFSTFSSHKPTS